MVFKLSKNKYTTELTSPEVKTIRKALSYFLEQKYTNLTICLDDNFEPYYYDDDGDIIKDKMDPLIQDHENISNIISKLWERDHSNNN